MVSPADVWCAGLVLQSGSGLEPSTAAGYQDTVGVPVPYYFSTLRGCTELQRGYYSQPPFAELLKMPEAQLDKVRNFRVGREGFGEISWQDPVDLTGAPRRFLRT